MSIEFWPGQEVGGVIVLKRLTPEVISQDHRKYLVRHGCCGKEIEMGFPTIYKRARDGLTRCAVCGNRVGGKGKRRGPSLVQKDRPAFQFIEEMHPNERPKIPSEAAILALWDRANARVGMRQGARG